MKLVLLRHPPVAAPGGTCYGSTDVALAPGWERWVDDVRRLLAGVRGETAVASSPLSRCRLPAEALGADVALDDRLRELDFGAWEGKPWGRIPRAELDRWNGDLVNAAPPGGESLRALGARVESFLDDARGADVEALVAFTHGGPIRCMLVHALAMPLGALFRLRADPGSVSIVSLSPAPPSVELVNLTLAGAGPGAGADRAGAMLRAPGSKAAGG